MSQTRLAVVGRAARHFDEDVGVGIAEALVAGRPVALGYRPSVDGKTEHGRDVKPASVVDKPVSRVRESYDRDSGAMPRGEPIPL
jgi:hypothetical protein